MTTWFWPPGPYDTGSLWDGYPDTGQAFDGFLDTPVVWDGFSGGFDTALGRGVALAPMASGIAVPLYLSTDVYELASGALTPLPVPTIPGSQWGFSSACGGASLDVWLTAYYGAAVNISSSNAVTIYSLPSGVPFSGVAMHGGNPYFLADSGTLYTLVSGQVSGVAGGFGEQSVCLSGDGTRLYAALPANGKLGIFTFTSPVSGNAAKQQAPMQTTSRIAASASGVAVVGWSSSVLASGTTNIDLSPSAALAVLASQSLNELILLGGTDPAWEVSGTVSGPGHPAWTAWSADGNQVMVADTQNNTVTAWRLISGALSLAQTLSVSGAVQLGCTPTTNQCLIAQTSQNEVSILQATADVWSLAQQVSLTGPTCLLVLADNLAAVGVASGVAWLEAQNGVWSVNSTTALTFTPLYIATDGNGNFWAAGDSGTGGAASALTQAGGVSATVPTPNTVTGLFWRQGQLFVGSSSGTIQVYFAVSGSLTFMQNITGGYGTGLNSIGQTGESVWLCGSSSTAQMKPGAPYSLVPLMSGEAAVWSGSSWSSLTLGVTHVPSAVTWDVSGTVWIATEQNDLYNLTAACSLISKSYITPYSPQPVSTPLGISSLLWYGGHLYGSSSLNVAVVEIV